MGLLKPTSDAIGAVQVCDAFKLIIKFGKIQPIKLKKEALLLIMVQSHAPVGPKDDGFDPQLLTTSISDCLILWIIIVLQEFREKNRKSKLFNHLSLVSEGIPAIGWVSVVSIF